MLGSDTVPWLRSPRGPPAWIGLVIFQAVQPAVRRYSTLLSGLQDGSIPRALSSACYKSSRVEISIKALCG